MRTGRCSAFEVGYCLLSKWPNHLLAVPTLDEERRMLAPDKALLIRLEECEQGSASAFRKGMEATEAIARNWRTDQ